MTEPIEIRNKLLRASRELDRREDGVVVMLRVENRNRMPVKFQLFDPLPGRLGADTVRFHPEDRPSHGRIDTELAVVSGVVEADEPYLTRYAIQGQGSPSEDELQRLQEAARPSIEISDFVGPGAEDEAVEAELDRAAMTRSASQRVPQESDRPSADSAALDQLWAGMDTTAESTDSDRPETTTTADPEPTHQPNDDDDYPSLAEVVQGLDEAYRDRESNSHDGVDEPTTDSEVDAAERLLEQLEAGEVSEAKRQRIADHLVDALDAEPPRSLVSRIEALESQLSAYGAYRDTLDGIIEEHGSPESLLGEIRQNVAVLAKAMEAIEQELEGAAVTRSRSNDTLEEVDDTLGRLASRTERLEDRVGSLRDEHRERAAEMESRLERFEPLAERVEELEAELEALAASAEAIEARRQSVWRAFFED